MSDESSKKSIKANNNDNLNKKYSDTLLLPKTNFSLRADTVNREILFQDRCSKDLYQWQIENNPKELFILHDGPPYANGNLHIGHALNKILKDIINRYKVLHGYKVNYIPGWDCHGLPIELKALTELKNVDKSSLTPLQIREVAKKSALDALEVQRKEFTSWGIMGDWENPYKTLDKEYEVRQLQVFHKMMKKGYIYRQNKPVYWSPSSRTALAEAELEYRDDHQSRSVYVKLPVIDSTLDMQDIPKDNLYVLIWTTTPWTLPANQAVAINQNMEYSIVYPNDNTSQNYYIIATKRLDALRNVLGAGLNVKSTFKGQQLIGTTYIHPINGQQCKIIDALHITEESGTGLVHIAPGHGMEDYETCKKLNIQTFCPVDEFGKFTSEVGESTFEGKPVLTDGTLAVIEYLKKRNILIREENYRHKYPYDWRTKKPIILRATAQWFANVEAIKQEAIKLIKDVEMIPKSAQHRLEQFTLSRSEWCISRQRSWGVPIPVFYELETDIPLLTDSSIEHIIEIFKKHGSDGWWKLNDRELLASEYRNDGKTYKKGNDTMDVWFDSGVSWTFIMEKVKRKDFKAIADLYLEGSDQHRGWFQSSLLTSVAVNNKAPYEKLITHGFVVDEQGRKMSKSLGNVIDPKTIIKGGNNLKQDPAYGIDVLRLWVASSEYVKDINIGKTVMSQVGENVRKYRNTARFMLGNLNNFRYNQLVEYEDLNLIDKYMLHEVYHFGKVVKTFYDEYTFNKVVQALNNFTNVLLSAFYFDIVKDRLYADHIISQSRRSVLTVLYHILNIYTISLSPIVPHLAEEIYENFKNISHKECDSVFKLGWYNLGEKWDNQPLQQEWNVLKYLRNEVNQLLEVARKDKVIKSSLEANVKLYVNPSELFNLLQKHDLKHIFITSDATISSLSSQMTEDNSKYVNEIKLSDGICKIVIERASLFKCPRCWNYNTQIEGELCKRCENVLTMN
ncbi:Isoleucyl-tRNA synthetase [Glomus cerebriforme]|uniref:isoleucine--tRNA ligase n=1 Tax=Glomus cerebriforme TaxID=658196 RepID=A0A397ST51_9GLOM|nr:Isoleucyl-tRNA synthetase [Glomus cerebriforme]